MPHTRRPMPEWHTRLVADRQRRAYIAAACDRYLLTRDQVRRIEGRSLTFKITTQDSEAVAALKRIQRLTNDAARSLPLTAWRVLMPSDPNPFPRFHLFGHTTH